jgi:hypothetical protein
MTDNVNHPAHYTAGNIECIDAIQEAIKGLDGDEGYLTGNIIKYMWRWKRKNGLEDLKKAKWYLERLIQEHGQANQTLPHKKIREEAPHGNSSICAADR